MANTTDPISHCLQRNWDMIESALAGMDDDMLTRAPAAECNSAAWILWHLSRVMDMFIHYRLQDAEQLWTKDGWAEKFNVQPGHRGPGRGLDRRAGGGLVAAVPRGAGRLLPRRQ